jgi:hypothetical protein
VNLTEITNAANAFCDENFDRATTIYFANEGIAVINSRLRSNLPAFDLSADYTALSDTYLRLLIIPYVSYSIKRNDGSIGEADRFFQNFLFGLSELESNSDSAIPEIFKTEEFGGVTQIDTEKAINKGWFHKNVADDWPWE